MLTLQVIAYKLHKKCIKLSSKVPMIVKYTVRNEYLYDKYAKELKEEIVKIWTHGSYPVIHKGTYDWVLVIYLSVLAKRVGFNNNLLIDIEKINETYNSDFKNILKEFKSINIEICENINEESKSINIHEIPFLEYINIFHDIRTTKRHADTISSSVNGKFTIDSIELTNGDIYTLLESDGEYHSNTFIYTEKSNIIPFNRSKIKQLIKD